MDNGQPIQIPNSPEMFTADNSFEADKNINLENWSPDRNPSTIGGIAMQSNGESPLPLPTTEKTNIPSEAYNPTSESLNPVPTINQNPHDLGQVIPIEPTPATGTPTDVSPIDGTDDSPAAYAWGKAMTGDRLSNKYIEKFDKRIEELEKSGDIASFVNFSADAGENFRKGNPKNSSLNQEAA